MKQASREAPAGLIGRTSYGVRALFDSWSDRPLAPDDTFKLAVLARKAERPSSAGY